MINAIRARISAAFLILFGTVALIASALLPAQASAAVFVSARPSIVMSRPVYVAPRPVYIAPRTVIIARPAVVYSPRPVIVARPPILVPYVAPTVVVPSYGQAVPVVVAHRSSGVSLLYAFLLILVIIVLFSGIGYGVYYVNPFGWWAVESSLFAVDSMLIDTVYVDADYGIDSGYGSSYE
jgi:hypothetical protein